MGASLHAWEYPAGPWERIHIDFAGPLDGKMYLVVVDAYSKWLDVEMMSSSKAGPTIAKLRRLFAVHGLPHVVVSDNGPNFASEEFKLFLKKNGIRQMFTAPYHPASNGQVERMVRTFKESFKTLKEGDAELRLSRLLFKYRITPHTTTGCSPAELLMGRKLRSALTLLKPDLGARVQKQQQAMEASSGSRRDVRVFEIGDLVWVRNFGVGEKWLAGMVQKKSGAVDYRVRLEAGQVVHRHIDQLLKRGARSSRDEEDGEIIGIPTEADAMGVSQTNAPVAIEEEQPDSGIELREVAEEQGTVEPPELDVSAAVPSTPQLRRSGRVCRRPDRLGDYVLS